MPSRDEEATPRRRRRTDYDRERDSVEVTSKEKDRDRDRDKDSKDRPPRSSKKLSKRNSSGDGAGVEREDRDSPRSQKSSTSDLPSTRSSRKVTMVVPEMERRPINGTASGKEPRPWTSYPTFSKAHSREAVGSREDVANPRHSTYTPDPTDLGQDTGPQKNNRRASTGAGPPPPTRVPPSPPLTAEDPDILRRSGSGASMRKAADRAKSDMESGRKSFECGPTSNGLKKSQSGSSLRKHTKVQDSEVSVNTATSRSTTTTMPGAFPEEPPRGSTPTSGYRRTVSTDSQQTSQVTQTDSNATSVAPERKSRRPPPLDSTHDTSASSFSNSSPHTPTPNEPNFPLSAKATPIIDVTAGSPQYSPASFGMNPMVMPPPPPPPPPPPVMAPTEVPRVDYLLKYGGLPHTIPKKLVGSVGQTTQAYSQYASQRLQQGASPEEYAKIFAPLKSRLDDYHKVLNKNGSLAVATGYTSIARRLLDRLEKVFMRNISSERCHCVVCNTNPMPALSDEEDSGVSWGEILEFVSGRRDLPMWPPFQLAGDKTGLGIAGITRAPMQKLDIDIPDEYRSHYQKQNNKTKNAVQNWLAHQAAPPPQEVDDDTLMFAMMTHINEEQRNLFLALLHGQPTLKENPRSHTPAERPASLKVLTKSALAVQRLYRLPHPPRSPEVTMFLLNNPDLHSMLATLAVVNEQEWDILISGRFDGFLWSGADATPFPPSASQWNTPAPSRGPSRGLAATPLSRNTTPFTHGLPPSRGSTPFSPLRNVMSSDHTAGGPPSMFPSRGPTPAAGANLQAPVQMDEETEIAVLAEVERAIFLDMEALEDQFEVLHKQAEDIRQLLRNRSAGLSMAAQMRRGSGAEDIGVRLDTPASGIAGLYSESEDGDGLEDAASLAPDDSASNISFNRRHRPNRRHERRTPAPVEEKDESEFEGKGYRHAHRHR